MYLLGKEKQGHGRVIQSKRKRKDFFKPRVHRFVVKFIIYLPCNCLNIVIYYIHINIYSTVNIYTHIYICILVYIVYITV
jgi:hypothetical protein